ncbi:YceI family protein [Sulfitobacter sp. D35]|uniref:YceI family protein n=1 Tax=Sulfitobacter sp. D35 TaxID=3083252 RepID=UPI00296FF295|nr:YceI family protein [Sulfitobacter sp. D35]MDW4496634.1 YceI family protein [Sulfitobacter sp. D35]
MPQTLTRRSLMIGALATFAAPATAASRRYVLTPGRSRIAFAFRLNGAVQTGTVPVANADIRIDPADLGATRADVSADLRRASTGFVFATEALKSPQVLDAACHPLVRYVTRAVRLDNAGRIYDGATVDGDLTMRGTTRPLRLAARLTRPQGTAETDLSRLFLRLSGSLQRSAFGATGYSDIVADRVDLDIRAEIVAA